MPESKLTSSFITNRIPVHIQNDYGTFVSFLKAFYEWSEQPGNADYHIDNILTYQDIDKTIAVFLDQFKQQYLLNFPDAMAQVQHTWSPAGKLTYTDLRKIIKNIRYFYEAKGTENSIRFLFRILYNSLVEIQYPKNDILTTSAGTWVQLKSIKVSYTNPEILNTLVGKTIREVNYVTGKTVAKANVESVILSSGYGLEYAELFLSSLQGTFTGAPLEFDSNAVQITISISDPYDGLDYNIGDKIYLVESSLPKREIANGKLASGTIVSWSAAPSGYPGSQLVVSPDADFGNFKLGVSPVISNLSGSIQYDIGYSLSSPVVVVGLKIQSTTTSIVVTNGGTGHVVGENVAISASPGDYGTGALATITKVGSSGEILNISLTSFGVNYQSTPDVQCSLSKAEEFELYRLTQYETAGDPTLRNALPYLTPTIKTWLNSEIDSGSIDYTDTTLTSNGYPCATSDGLTSAAKEIIVRSILASNLSSTNKLSYQSAVEFNDFTVLSAFDRSSLKYCISTYTFDLVKSQLGATAKATIGYVGSYIGYYSTSANLLSSTSKIQDSNYYQAYSYVLETEVAYDRFAQNIRELVHPAGMMFFGRVLLSRVLEGSFSVSDRIDLIEEPVIEYYAGYTQHDKADRYGQVVSGHAMYHHPNTRIPNLVAYDALPQDRIYTTNPLTDAKVPGFKGWRVVGYGDDGVNTRGTRFTSSGSNIADWLNVWTPTNAPHPAIMRVIPAQTEFGEIPIGAFLTMRLGGGPDSVAPQYSDSSTDSTHNVTLTGDSAYSYPTS